MKVRALITLLLNNDLDAEAICLNINDPHDEFAAVTDKTTAVTAVVELDEGVALYYIGDKPKSDED